MVQHAAMRRFTLAISAAGLLHLLALMAWMTGRGPTGALVAERAPALLTRWLTAAPPPPHDEPVRAARPSRAVRVVPGLAPRAAQPAPVEAPVEAQAMGGAAATPAAPPLTRVERALSPDIVQRAVHESARQRGVATLANDQLAGSPPTPQERLVASVAAGARTDCLKGGAEGHRGQGLGLFNLPLLAFDAATGRCR